MTMVSARDGVEKNASVIDGWWRAGISSSSQPFLSRARTYRATGRGKHRAHGGDGSSDRADGDGSGDIADLSKSTDESSFVVHDAERRRLRRGGAATKDEK
jgi:hypothetical protein